jgi:glutathione S-transferase
VKLYDYGPSGNCYKVRLLLAQLGITYQRVPVDLKKGEARTPEFKGRFPLGRVPVVELDDGTVLAESNALLLHFGEGTPYVPTERLARSEAFQWMFWEQYIHEPALAVVRAWRAYYGVPAGKEAELLEREAKGYAALDTMEQHLAKRTWLTGTGYSVADIALYAYTHVAPEGGFELKRYPAIGRWMARVAEQPGHIPITV